MADDDRSIIEMRDSSVGVSKENLIASVEAKGKAMEAIYEGKFHEAIKYLNQAILLNPSSAIMYATRAAVYNKMKKAKAAILDANTALQINPKSSRGYKYREMALPMLGEWEEAAKDDIHAMILDVVN